MSLWGQCKVVSVNSKNSTIIINCGGTQQVLRGQNQIIEYLSEINKKTEILIDLIEQKKDSNEDVAQEIKELKEYITIVLIISNQIKSLQENANRVTKGAVERLIYRGFFFEACSILEESKNQSELSQLKTKACQLSKLLENSEKYFDDKNFLLSFKYADSIKIVGGDKLVSYGFTKKIMDNIKSEFQKIAKSDIVDKFDDINCHSCPIQNTKSPRYLEVYETFVQIYNFNPNNFSQWYESDLKWFVKHKSNDTETKSIHSEVLYKICFMFHHDFAKVNKKKIQFKKQWLSNFINLSIEVNSKQSDENKKLDLRKSING